MKKVQLELWATFDKLCLLSAITKLKTSFADQNWVTISRYTKQLYETISSCIEYDRRSDDWFSAKQCAAQYEFLIKGSGVRKKKRIDRNTDYTDIHDALLTSLTQEFCQELQESLVDIREDYCKTKKLIEDIDNDRIDDEKLEDLITEMVEKEKASDIKSKLKSMLDEKNANELENTSKYLLQQTLMASEASTSGEQKTTNVTTSPLLTSLLQSPSPLVRPSPSTSSPTISLLLHSSPPVSLTDSTLSKLLETPSTLPTTSTVTSVETPSTIFQAGNVDPQLSLADTETKTTQGEEGLVQRVVKDTEDYEKQEIFDDMSDIEQGVVESEVIIENESSPIKRLTPRRLDMEVEDEEPEEEILETVEEIIERVEEAIIETVGENNLNELVLSEAIETVSISDDEIGNMSMEENTYEVIVVGSSQENEQTSNSVSDDSVIIEEPIDKSVNKIDDDRNKESLVKSPCVAQTIDEDISKKSAECQNSEVSKDALSKDAPEDITTLKAVNLEEVTVSKVTPQLGSIETNSIKETSDEEKDKIIINEGINTSKEEIFTEHPSETKESQVQSGLGDNLSSSGKHASSTSTDKIESNEHEVVPKLSGDVNDSAVSCKSSDMIHISNNKDEEICNLKKEVSAKNEIVCNADKMEESVDLDHRTSDKELVKEKELDNQSTCTQNGSEEEINNQYKAEIENKKSTTENEFNLEEKNIVSEIKTAAINENLETLDIAGLSQQLEVPNEEVSKQINNSDANDGDKNMNDIKTKNIENEESTLVKELLENDKINKLLVNNKQDYSNQEINRETDTVSTVEESDTITNDVNGDKITHNSSNDEESNEQVKESISPTILECDETSVFESTVQSQEQKITEGKPSDENRSTEDKETLLEASETVDSFEVDTFHAVESLSPDNKNITSKFNEADSSSKVFRHSKEVVSDNMNDTISIEDKNDCQIQDTEKIISCLEETHVEDEDIEENFERYSDKLDETDEDSYSKDKSDTTEETEDTSLMTTEDSKDDLDDSCNKFSSSLETLSTTSVESPPDSLFNDPRFAILRSKELALRSLMKESIADVKSKGASLVLSDEEDEVDSNVKNERSKLKKQKNSKGNVKKKLILVKSTTEKNSKEKPFKGKGSKGRPAKEKLVKERVSKEKPSKDRLSKDKPSNEKPMKSGRKARHLSSVDSKPDSPSLSTTSSDEDRDYRSWKKSILLVYNRLASHKYASVFSKPITENEAPSYHQLILRPMDLSTIKRNIENGIIRTTVEFQRDMLLMVQNAIIYNKYDTPVYDMAKVMGEDMLAQMEVMVQALGDGVPLIGDAREEKQITRARTSKSSVDTPQNKKRKNQDPDEIRPKRNKVSASSS